MSVPFLISRQFDDFDEFCLNARPWDLDYQQLERGCFNGQLLLAGSADMQFTRSRLGRRLIQKGAPPRHLRTFGLLADPRITMHWRGQNVSGDQLFVFPEGGELDCVSQSDFDVSAVALSEKTLAEACQSLRLPGPEKLFGDREVFACDPGEIHLLREFLMGAERQLRIAGPQPDLLKEIAIEAADRLVSIVARGKYTPERDRPRKREIALAKARDYVEANFAQQLSIPELCQIAHASERTLEYAFRERYGVTPKYYVTACRLNAAKKALFLASPGDTTVSDVALEVGFWHRSKFSEDYKRLFGELPSITLQRRIR